MIALCRYLKLLFRPWKLATFTIAFIGMVALGPISNDVTWNTFTAGAMSLLTFLTAPFVVQTLMDKRAAWYARMGAIGAICQWDHGMVDDDGGTDAAGGRRSLAAGARPRGPSGA